MPGDPERAAHVSALAEIAWLMENSDGVAGLRLPGYERVMSWSVVRDLYLPSWRDHFGDAEAPSATADQAGQKCSGAAFLAGREGP